MRIVAARLKPGPFQAVHFMNEFLTLDASFPRACATAGPGSSRRSSLSSRAVPLPASRCGVLHRAGSFPSARANLVAGGHAGLDPVVQALHSRVFELQI